LLEPPTESDEIECVELRLHTAPPLSETPIGTPDAPNIDAAGVGDAPAGRFDERRLSDIYSFVVEALDEGLLLQDAVGRVVDANPAARRILGLTREELIAGEPDSAPWSPIGRDGRPIAPYHRPGLRAIATGLPQRHKTMGFTRGDGEQRWAEVTAVPIGGREQGHATHAALTFRDITDDLLVSEELEFQARLLEAVGDAIIGADERLEITFWNPAAERLFGYSRAEAVGRPIETILPGDSEDPSTAFLSEPADVDPRLVVGRHKAGHLIHVSVTLSPTFDQDGHFLGGALVARDISDQVRADQEAERQRERATVAERAAQREAVDREAAERANRAKSEFLSRMSHELRTPLNAVLGFGQILRQASGLTAEDAEGVDYILTAGTHLLDLINEVLDIARIETEQLNLSLEPVDIADVLRESIALLRPTAAERSITIKTAVDPSPIGFVRADRQRLLQVALNLLSNAVKYNVKGGEVDVQIKSVGGSRLRIEVRDTGPGIAAADLDRLFTPFDRLGAEGSGIEGTGVGLALSKGLVEQMDGTMGVTTYPGEGSNFWFELATAEPQMPLPPAEVSGSRCTSSARSLKVLYIEDNLPNLKVVEAMLATRPGVELLSAMQGNLGLQLARHHRPDLILLDVHLPDTQGSDVLRAIRDDSQIRETAVAIVSADVTPKQIERMRALGSDFYLTKPIDMSTLLATVERVASARPG
jgi:PAS domain S-box-containing protein